jgi:hypothetical protein
MDLIVSWVLFPAAFVSVCAGAGLLVELVAGCRLPASALPAAGLAALIVLGTALTVADSTAELAAPACVALAVAGFATAVALRQPVPRGLWPFAAAAAAFAVYAAPVVLSGEATIAGFIKLDDTATWLAFADRIADHGRDLDGLAPSTYEAALALNIGDGYPVGAFVALAVSSSLSGVDPAWLVQPYIATLAAVLALALWALATPLRAQPALRAAASAVGATSALLVGYGLWGGIKEVLAAALLAATVALTLPALERDAPARTMIPAALAAAAVVAALSAAGTIWLLPIAAGAWVALAAVRGGPSSALRVAGAAALVAVLSLPTLIPGGVRPPTSAPLDDSGALGNLAGPLDPLQLAGIWASGDFRLQPADELATITLAALACALAAGAVLEALRRREVGLPLLVLGVLGGCAILAFAGSPWVEGKAFASASIAIPFAAMVGAGLLACRGRAILGTAAAVAVAGGVLWSNALAYQDVNLAPREQLSELERIGALLEGEGPTLMTEYSPYGARHFLRAGDPESISELRRREIPLRNGARVPKDESADTDAIDPQALSVYRSLVVRRSPAQSRPPAAYRLVWGGETYELWQRAADARPAAERLGLGGPTNPVAVPRCARVRRLARAAAPGATLVAARHAAPLVKRLSEIGVGTITAEVEVPRTGEYEIWLGGSVRSLAEAGIDGRPVGSVRHELNNEGGYVSFGTAAVGAGIHAVALRFHGPDFAPGSDGGPEAVGPLAMSSATAADSRLRRVSPADAADRLCGRAWDWIELDAGGA